MTNLMNGIHTREIKKSELLSYNNKAKDVKEYKYGPLVGAPSYFKDKWIPN